MGNAKKFAIGAGIAAIWIGGFIVCWKTGEIIGKITHNACMSTTEKLLALI